MEHFTAQPVVPVQAPANSDSRGAHAVFVSILISRNGDRFLGGAGCDDKRTFTTVALLSFRDS